VGGGGSPRTSSWFSSILSSSVSSSSHSASCSLALSCSSALLCCFSSLSSVSSALSCCLIFDVAVVIVVSLTSDRAGMGVTCHTSSARSCCSGMVVFLQVAGAAVSMDAEMVAVVVVGAGVGSEVVVVETWHRSAAGSAISEVAIFSMSRFSNEACKAVIMFCTLSWNGSVQDSAQYSCMQSNLALTFATVSQLSFASHAGTVAVSVCVVGELFVAAVGSTIVYVAIGAV
jgi:hypothetical protein